MDNDKPHQTSSTAPAPAPHLPRTDDSIALTGDTSPGVRRIEAISKHIRPADRWVLFFAVFLIAYAYGLDGTLRYVYQPYATGSYDQHSLLATVNVLRAVIAAAAQPTAAKIADVFGRMEMVMLSVFFYILGTIVECASHSLAAFCAGAVLYQIGYSAILVLVEIIIGDVTSTRARLFFSYIPALPFLINTWVSGNISTAVLNTTNWRWGIGMWGIIYFVCSIPLIVTLYIVARRAARAADLESYKTPYKMMGAGNLVLGLFWQLDVIGVILLIAVLALVLVPLTVAGGAVTAEQMRENWRAAHVIAPLVIGVVLIPVWAFWETRARHPMIPFRLLKDRGVWACIGIAIMLNFAWTLQGDYLFTVLRVAFDLSVETATRVTNFYSFFSVITGVLVGAVVYFVKHLKPFIVFGTLLFTVAYGLLIEYRGGGGSAGVIGAQVLLGIAGGFFPYAAQASIQTATRHEHLAIVTGVYLASYNIGSALGNCVSGAIWSNVLPSQLDQQLSLVTNNSTMAGIVFADPLTLWVYEYPWDTPERQAVVDAYRVAQKLLCITGICLCVPLIIFACLIRNPKLGNTQSIAGAEGMVSDSDEAELVEQQQASDEKGFLQILKQRLGKA